MVNSEREDQPPQIFRKLAPNQREKKEGAEAGVAGAAEAGGVITI